MLNVELREQIRRAYYIEDKSMRQIAREQGHARKTVKKALEAAEAQPYRRNDDHPAPVLGPYKERIQALLTENEHLPRKQQYTGERIYDVLCAEGYTGSASGVRRYIGELRQATRQRPVYLPLEYDPGVDAQVDWGEAQFILRDQPQTAQLLVFRLCYSRKLLVQAYPTQRQECFLDGHVVAFHYFGGVPQRLVYDNLKTAVYAILAGRNRQEQDTFVTFRSHYLFESRYCTPGQGHEKGGVEHGVGFSRRNFLVPLPAVDSFEELNAYLLARCQAEDRRTVQGQKQTIGEAWAIEQPLLRPLPEHDFVCCVTREVKLNPYSQVVFETNRYSVPTDQAYPNLVLRAFPFRIEILHGDQVLAVHPRCYDRHQDLIDPLHYLPLLEQRPGAFEHAQPIRQWRQDWPPVYERVLTALQQRYERDQAIRQFIQVLSLHRVYPANMIVQAMEQALSYGCAHYDGVLLCLRQAQQPALPAPVLDLSAQPHLAQIGTQPLTLDHYDRLLMGGDDGH